MTEIVDATADRDDAVAAAAGALRAGELVVLPTDTVYGVAADAFNPGATTRIFDVKRRQRRHPLPVLIRSPKQLMGLVPSVTEAAENLMAAYWPGPLTIVVRTDPNLAWDLGRNENTVAVRMPMDEVTLDVIRAVGPLAVTSANLSGQNPATTARLAHSQLGDAVEVYVDGGRRSLTEPSTIVDLTRRDPAVLRSGPLDDDEVLAVARGELEPHLASPPETTKPISPGGPADTTPVAAAAAAAGDGDRAVDRDAEVAPAPPEDPADAPEHVLDSQPEPGEPVPAPPTETVAEAGPGEPVPDPPTETVAEAEPVSEADPAAEPEPAKPSEPAKPPSRHVARDHRAP